MLLIPFSYLLWKLGTLWLKPHINCPGSGKEFEYKCSKLNLHAKHNIVLKSFYKLLASSRYSWNMSREWEILWLFLERKIHIFILWYHPWMLEQVGCYTWRLLARLFSKESCRLVELGPEARSGSLPRVPHTCFLLLCDPQPTHRWLMMKSICHLLIMCWLCFLLLLVCFPSHCIWSVGKCFMSWDQSPGILWAWWIRLRLQLAPAVSCLATWVMQRLGGHRRCRAPSGHRTKLLQCLWTYRSFGERKGWLQIENPRRTNQCCGAVNVWEETEKPGECQWTSRGLAAQCVHSFPAETLRCLLSFHSIFPGIFFEQIDRYFPSYMSI